MTTRHVAGIQYTSVSVFLPASANSLRHVLLDTCDFPRRIFLNAKNELTIQFMPKISI